MKEDKNKKAKPERDRSYLLWFWLPGIIAILWGIRVFKDPLLSAFFDTPVINLFSYFIVISLVVGGFVLSCVLFLGGLAVESIKSVKENNDTEEENIKEDKQLEENLPEIDSKEASESTAIMVITCIIIFAILDIFVFDTHIIKFIIEIIRDVVNIWR